MRTTTYDLRKEKEKNEQPFVIVLLLFRIVFYFHDLRVNKWTSLFHRIDRKKVVIVFISVWCNFCINSVRSRTFSVKNQITTGAFFSHTSNYLLTIINVLDLRTNVVIKILTSKSLSLTRGIHTQQSKWEHIFPFIHISYHFY